MSKVKSVEINYADPGYHTDQQEFEQMIRQAEKGLFHTITTVKTELKKR